VTVSHSHDNKKVTVVTNHNNRHFVLLEIRHNCHDPATLPNFSFFFSCARVRSEVQGPDGRVTPQGHQQLQQGDGLRGQRLQVAPTQPQGLFFTSYFVTFWSDLKLFPNIWGDPEESWIFTPVKWKAAPKITQYTVCSP
jgi:hypothetical protein